MDYRTHEVGASTASYWFKGRQDFITKLFNKIAPFNKNQKILNVGSGTGHDLENLNKMGKIYALDIEPSAIALVPDFLVAEKKVGDVCNIPYPDNSFDIVVALDMLEHVENDKQAVKDIFRVLKPGGHFVFTIPAFNALFSGHDKAMHHHRRYNKKMVTALTTQFEKVELNYWFFFLFAPAALHRLATRNSNSQSPYMLPAILDKTILGCLKLENFLIEKGVKFPFGLSVYGIYKKPF